jgi:hypothetical protein
MEKENYQNDLLAIRTMMERSSRFISLSGLSGVFAGLYAVAGALYAYFYLHNPVVCKNTETVVLHPHLTDNVVLHLLLVALLVLVLAVSTAAFFTIRKSRKNGLHIWDSTTHRLIFNFAVPLGVGGIFCLILLWHSEFAYLAPATLVFYGMALFAAGNFTFSDIKVLGICEMILGLLSLIFIGYGLLFWTLGFGVLHIIYGIVIYQKYK